MPPSNPSAPTAPVRLRRLQTRLGELSVPALLRVRDAIEPLLAREHIRVRDVDVVLHAADED